MGVAPSLFFLVCSRVHGSPTEILSIDAYAFDQERLTGPAHLSAIVSFCCAGPYTEYCVERGQ